MDLGSIAASLFSFQSCHPCCAPHCLTVSFPHILPALADISQAFEYLKNQTQYKHLVAKTYKNTCFIVYLQKILTSVFVFSGNQYFCWQSIFLLWISISKQQNPEFSNAGTCGWSLGDQANLS